MRTRASVIWLGVSVLVCGGAVLGLALGYGAEELLLAAALAGVGLIIATTPALLSRRTPIAQGLKG